MVEFDHHLNFPKYRIVLKVLTTLQAQLHPFDGIVVLLEFVGGLEDDSLSPFPNFLHIHEAVLKFPVFKEELEGLSVFLPLLGPEGLPGLQLEALPELHRKLLHQIVLIGS